MKRGDEEFSDKRVTIFLIAAIVISLVSTWTVLTTLHEVTSNPRPQNTQIIQQPLASGGGSGLVSLTILEPKEPINGTEQ